MMPAYWLTYVYEWLDQTGSQQGGFWIDLPLAVWLLVVYGALNLGILGGVALERSRPK